MRPREVVLSLLVQLAEQEDFDFGAGFLLVAVEAGGEDLGVVEDHHVLLLEVVDDVLEDAVLDFARFAVDDHQTRFVAVFGRIFRQQVGREVVVVL